MRTHQKGFHVEQKKWDAPRWILTRHEFVWFVLVFIWEFAKLKIFVLSRGGKSSTLSEIGQTLIPGALNRIEISLGWCGQFHSFSARILTQKSKTSKTFSGNIQSPAAAPPPCPFHATAMDLQEFIMLWLGLCLCVWMGVFIFTVFGFILMSFWGYCFMILIVRSTIFVVFGFHLEFGNLGDIRAFPGRCGSPWAPEWSQ